MDDRGNMRPDNKIVVNTTIDENQKHPLVERKLEEANRILKKVGLPKGW